MSPQPTHSHPTRSLAQELRSRDDEQLRLLLAARGDLLSPLPTDISALASRASAPPSISRALDSLNLWEIQVLEALVALPEPITIDAVVAATSQDAKVVIEKLIALALIFPDEDQLRILNAIRDSVGNEPTGLGPVLGLLSAKAIKKIKDAPENARTVLDRLTWGPPRGSVSDIKKPGVAIKWLLDNDLLLAVDSKTVVLPREIGMHLRGGKIHRELQNQPTDYRGREFSQSEIDKSAVGAIITLLHQIEELMKFWSGEPPAILRSGGIGVREVKKAADALGVEENYLIFIAELSYICGLVTVDREEELLPTSGFDLWLNSTHDERWQLIVNGWLTTSRVSGLVGKSEARYISALGPEIDRAAAANLRALFLKLVSEISPCAPDLSELSKRVRWERPRRGVGLHADIAHWSSREAEWLGITGRGAISSFGSAILNGKEDSGLSKALPKEIDHILIQADNTAIAPGPLRIDLAQELSLIANVESKGGATVYRFSENSIRRGLDSGRSSDEINKFLTKISKTSIPQPLSYLIADVGKRHGKLRVGIGWSSYIRCEDESVVNAILADRRTAHLQLRKIAPQVLFTEVDTEEAVNTLIEAGFLPAIEGRDGALVTRKRSAARAISKTRPPRVIGEYETPRDELLTAALRALRAGDRASAKRSGVPTTVASATPTETMAALTVAIKNKETLVIGYADSDGGVSQRIIDPIQVMAGVLVAYDHGNDEVLRFPVSRINGIALVE